MMEPEVPRGPVFRMKANGVNGTVAAVLIFSTLLAWAFAQSLGWVALLIVVPGVVASAIALLTSRATLELDREGLLRKTQWGRPKRIPWEAIAELRPDMRVRHGNRDRLVIVLFQRPTAADPEFAGAIDFDFGPNTRDTFRHVQEMFAFIRQHSDLVEVDQAWGLPVLRRLDPS